MRIRGTEVGLDYSFVIDPDNDGSLLVLEDGNGNRAYPDGTPGVVVVEVRDFGGIGFDPYKITADNKNDEEDAGAIIKRGRYLLREWEHDECDGHVPDDFDGNACALHNLADLMDWMYEDEKGFMGAKLSFDPPPPDTSHGVFVLKSFDQIKD